MAQLDLQVIERYASIKSRYCMSMPQRMRRDYIEGALVLMPALSAAW